MNETGEIENIDIKRRKDRFFSFIKNKNGLVIILLIIAVILGIYIRFLPMTDHGGNPGLYDVSTKNWTLGPDLDPWLFLRNAEKIINEGKLPEIDNMRNVPLGFDNSIESQLLPYMIVYTHKIINIFGNYPIEFSGSLFPVLMFAFTIISFFLFVRELFLIKNEENFKASIIAIISTFFMIVIPVFLPRTVAGIPEKESAAFFFLFLSLYFFLKGWKTEKFKNSIFFGLTSGISTGLMALVWGGVIYAFIPIALASLSAFILNKFNKNKFFVYLSWIVSSIFIMVYFSNKYKIFTSLTSLSSGSAVFVLFVIIVHYVILGTKIKDFYYIKESKLPKTILSFIIAIIVLLILVAVFIGPDFIVQKIKAVHQTIFKPIFGRWNITVAENKQPNFQEWSGSFGPYFKNIPLMFSLFLIGSIVLFKKTLNIIKNNDTWILTAGYVFFISGIIYSRYSDSSLFNGENLISKSFYYLSLLVFLFLVIKYYIIYYKKGDNSFSEIRYEYLLLFSLFIVSLFTVRGAVRLIMVLGPVASIFVGFIIVEIVDKYFKTKEEMLKIFVGIFAILILVASFYTFYNFYQDITIQSYNFVPSAYNIQWQKAMEWVRDNTPENAVFSHWWDYGYWVQSIGKRATMVDGGNAITYWNYLVGRYVLTGDNQNDALEVLYNHNVSYFLIDSSDIGKYTAFSSIGSDKNFDRFSYISTYLLDDKQTKETSNQTLYVYSGGTFLDEDWIIEQDGKKILLPANSAGVGAIIIPADNNKKIYQQPYVIVVYQGQQYDLKLRYLYINNNLADFGNGIEATVYVFPRLNVNNGGVQVNEKGAAMFLSPRLMRGMLAQVYILDNALGKFPNFKLAHVESALIVKDLNSQGLPLPEFVYYNGILGPIKIWKIEYTGKEKIKPEYIDRDETKYLDWLL
ncbi:MAG: STT3 domain-containing protein [Nanoarchaeota archaeon]